MSISKIIKDRRTVYEFSDKKVSDALLTKILDIARWSPSSHNSQPWSMIVIRDKKMIENLVELAYYGDFHTPPNVLIVLISEPIYKEKPSLLNGELKKHAEPHKLMNIGFLGASLIYSAEALGVDSCILSAIDKRVSKLLNIPKEKNPLLMIGLGYEKEGAFHKKRERKSLDEIVFHESYKK